MRGLHGAFLSLLAAGHGGDAATVRAATATWHDLAAQQPPRAALGAVQVLDKVSGALVLVPAEQVANALPPVPHSLTDTTGIINFLNGIDRRIHDAFGNPQSSDPTFDANVATVVGGLNEAAVTIAQMAVIGLLIPGGQAIGAILLVGAGVAAVGAAAISLFGSLVDLFSSTQPATVAVPDPRSKPFTPGDPPQPPADPPADPPPLVDPAAPATTNDPPATRKNDPPVDPPVDPGTEVSSPVNDPGAGDIPATRENDPPASDMPADTSGTAANNTGAAGGEVGGGEAGGAVGGGEAGGGGTLTVHEPPRTEDEEGDQG